MRDRSIPFNPLERKNLEASVAEALLSSDPESLGGLSAFLGAGIYAIYYSGKFPAYVELARRNQDNDLTAPIYVGKAVHAGSRKGVTEGDTTRKPLYNRLCEHADSIRIAENLDIDDFKCRFVVVEDIWIPLGESLLIARYSPVWNSLIDGFGNHDPGRGRYQGMRPRWDVLHPGRRWAARCADRMESAEDIVREVENHLRNASYPASTNFMNTN